MKWKRHSPEEKMQRGFQRDESLNPFLLRRRISAPVSLNCSSSDFYSSPSFSLLGSPTCLYISVLSLSFLLLLPFLLRCYSSNPLLLFWKAGNALEGGPPVLAWGLQVVQKCPEVRPAHLVALFRWKGLNKTTAVFSSTLSLSAFTLDWFLC